MSRKRLSATGGGPNRAAFLCMSNIPTEDDVRRIRKARREARARYAAIEAMRNIEAVAAFRAELSAVVRSASSVLIALLASDGLTLDDAMALVDPALFWPRKSSLSRRSFWHPARNHLLRYYIAGIPPGQPSPWPLPGHTFDRAEGGYITMNVVDHSLELEARIAPVWLTTRFGELRVQLDDALPDTLATACIGRMVDDIVDHPAWRGRGWRILEVEEPVASYFGQTLIVAAGSVPYRISWPKHAVSNG